MGNLGDIGFYFGFVIYYGKKGSVCIDLGLKSFYIIFIYILGSDRLFFFFVWVIGVF